MSLMESLLEEDARPMGASAMRAALNPNVGNYQWEGQGYEEVNPPPYHIPALAVGGATGIHGYEGGSYPTGLAAVAPASGCRSCMRPAASPALSIHGFEGGSIATGLAAALPSYEYGQLTPGGSYGTGLAAMRPAVSDWRDGAYPALGATLSYADACAQARPRLQAAGYPNWNTDTCAQLGTLLTNQPTLFVCPDPIRCALAPTTCSNCPTPEIIPGVDNTLLYAVGGGLALLLVVAVVAKNLRPRHAAMAPAGR